MGHRSPALNRGGNGVKRAHSGGFQGGLFQIFPNIIVRYQSVMNVKQRTKNPLFSENGAESPRRKGGTHAPSRPPPRSYPARASAPTRWGAGTGAGSEATPPARVIMARTVDSLPGTPQRLDRRPAVPIAAVALSPGRTAPLRAAVHPATLATAHRRGLAPSARPGPRTAPWRRVHGVDCHCPPPLPGASGSPTPRPSCAAIPTFPYIRPSSTAGRVNKGQHGPPETLTFPYQSSAVPNGYDARNHRQGFADADET